MRIGLAVDATCDLPQAFIKQHNITVMPIVVRLDGKVFKDNREPEETERFRFMKSDDTASAETEPCSVEDLQKLFLEKLVLEYDCVFSLTIMASRSPIHEHMQKASFAVLKQYRGVRDQAGVPGPFYMRVLDTRNVFAGEGPIAVEAIRLIEAGETRSAIGERLNMLANNTYGYMLPRDLYHLRNRTKKRGDRSVSLFSAVVGSALDIKPLLRCYRGETGPVGKVRGFEQGAQTLFSYAAKRVRIGLLAPVMCVSYGGDLSDLDGLPGYDELRSACVECGVMLMEAPMSITGMVNVGMGAVTIGFAAEEHTAEF